MRSAERAFPRQFSFSPSIPNRSIIRYRVRRSMPRTSAARVAVSLQHLEHVREVALLHLLEGGEAVEERLLQRRGRTHTEHRGQVLHSRLSPLAPRARRSSTFSSSRTLPGHRTT